MVEHGVSGLVVDDLDQLVAAVHHIAGLDRRACRARVETTYSETAVVEAYLKLYRERLARQGVVQQ
mgnify:FL=1